MTGLFIKLPDGQGQWRSVEIEKLTEQELVDWVLKLDELRAKQWLMMMVRLIRDNVHEEPATESDQESLL